MPLPKHQEEEIRKKYKEASAVTIDGIMFSPYGEKGTKEIADYWIKVINSALTEQARGFVEEIEKEKIASPQKLTAKRYDTCKGCGRWEEECQCSGINDGLKTAQEIIKKKP